jgi:hypothetical protein
LRGLDHRHHHSLSKEVRTMAKKKAAKRKPAKKAKKAKKGGKKRL